MKMFLRSSLLSIAALQDLILSLPSTQLRATHPRGLIENPPLDLHKMMKQKDQSSKNQTKVESQKI